MCLKATGGLELELCLSGYQAKHPIRLVIPSRIANYRKSLTLRNKIDCDDARLIACAAMTMPTVDWQPPSPAAQCLHDLLKRHRILTQMYITLRNRMQQCSACTLLDTSNAASSKLTLLLRKSLPLIISLGRPKAYCVLFPVSLLRQQPCLVLALILILLKLNYSAINLLLAIL